MKTHIVDQARSVGSPAEADTILDSVRALLPTIAARSDEIEHGRRLPLDLVAPLRDAGCFRTLVPRRFGGAEPDLADHMAVCASWHVPMGRWAGR